MAPPDRESRYRRAAPELCSIGFQPVPDRSLGQAHERQHNGSRANLSPIVKNTRPAGWELPKGRNKRRPQRVGLNDAQAIPEWAEPAAA